jgi:hypothetical protein
MFNSVLSIVSLFTTKEVAIEDAAPPVERRQPEYGVRLAVLCTDLYEAMEQGRWKDVEYLRKQIEALMAGK